MRTLREIAVLVCSALALVFVLIADAFFELGAYLDSRRWLKGKS